MRNLFGLQTIIERLLKSKFVDSDENVKDENGFVLFERNDQKTWLVFSNKQMFGILDDLKSETVSILFRVCDNDISTLWNTMKLEEIPNSEKHGMVYFPNIMNGYRYSKNLFPNRNDLIRQIKFHAEQSGQ